MTPLIGVAADLLVAVLLAATIVTSLGLSRRIRKLKADEQTMRGTVAELVAATDSAERAVTALRRTLAEGERTLGQRIGQAGTCEAALAERIRSGEAVVERIDGLADMFRRSSEVVAAIARSPATPGRAETLRSTEEALDAMLRRGARRTEERAA